MAAHPPAPIDQHATDAAHSAAEAAALASEHTEGGGFPPFEPELFASQLFWFVITFGALYFILSRVVLPRVASVMDARAGAVKSDLDQAAQKSADADDARAAMEKATAKARAEARAMIDAARADITAKLTAEQEAAEQRLAERIAVAEARVDAARQKALVEVPALAETLARDIADKLAPASRSPSPAAPRQPVAGDV